jgi:hypothetical protein
VAKGTLNYINTLILKKSLASSYPMGTKDSFLGVKRPGREADHSPQSSAEVKECVELYPQYAFMAWCLVKHRDKFTFTGYSEHYTPKNINRIKFTKKDIPV